MQIVDLPNDLSRDTTHRAGASLAEIVSSVKAIRRFMMYLIWLFGWKFVVACSCSYWRSFLWSKWDEHHLFSLFQFSSVVIFWREHFSLWLNRGRIDDLSNHQENWLVLSPNCCAWFGELCFQWRLVPISLWATKANLHCLTLDKIAILIALTSAYRYISDIKPIVDVKLVGSRPRKNLPSRGLNDMAVQCFARMLIGASYYGCVKLLSSAKHFYMDAPQLFYIIRTCQLPELANHITYIWHEIMRHIKE